MFIYDAAHDLVSFVLFKKRGKHPWRSDTFSKVTNRARGHIYLGRFYILNTICTSCVYLIESAFSVVIFFSTKIIKMLLWMVPS